MCSSKHRIRPGLCPKQIMKLRGLETVSGNRLDGGPTQGEQSASRETDSLSSGLPPMQSTPKAHPKGWSLSEEASHEKLKPIPPFTLGQHLGTFSWDEMDGKKGYRIHHLADRRGQQSNALLHQLDYRENSDRMYRLYGHGRYDWGFTPNSDMGILFTVMLTRVVEEQNLSALFHIYQRLLAAARQVDISAADLRAQLYAEYGIDPLLACPPPASSSMEAARRRAQEEQGRIAFRKNKIELMRFILSCGEPKYASSIEVDAHGDPVYRERDSRHGCCVLCADAQDWR